MQRRDSIGRLLAAESLVRVLAGRGARRAGEQACSDDAFDTHCGLMCRDWTDGSNVMLEREKSQLQDVTVLLYLCQGDSSRVEQSRDETWCGSIVQIR